MLPPYNRADYFTIGYGYCFKFTPNVIIKYT